MIVKAVTLFLIGMLILGMFGKLRLPGRKRPPEIGAKPRKCKKCGSYIVGSGGCACGNRS